MDVLPHRYDRELCLAPGITAQVGKAEDYVLTFSELSLCTKIEMIFDKLSMPSVADQILGLEAQLSLKLLNIAPVLTAMALTDMSRLDTYSAIDLIKVCKVTPNPKHGETKVPGILPTATLVTWAL